MSLEVDIRRSWKGFSLDVAFETGGEFTGILGASGSGKSMTLKCIAGVETPREGRIRAGDRTLFDSARKINRKPQRRRVGYLFQHYALFPHMTVEGNICCGLSHLPGRQRKPVAEDLLRRFRLEGLSDRYPGQLSGGQQQRVALARILAYEPDTLLLDEPFSALDTHLRDHLQMELMDLLRGFRGDVVLVTHNREEAYRFCKRLVALEQGRCVAQGETQALFRDPGLSAVARITGCRNISPARKTGERRLYAEDWGVELTTALPVGEDVDRVGIYAHRLEPADGAEEGNRIPVRLREKMEGPLESTLLLDAGKTERPGALWWSAEPRGCAGEAPKWLRAAPEHVLPLRSSGKRQGKDEAQ